MPIAIYNHKVPMVPCLYGIVDPYTGKYWGGQFVFVDRLDESFLTSKIASLLAEWNKQATSTILGSPEVMAARSRAVIAQIKVCYDVLTVEPDDPFNNPSHVANMGNLMAAITGGFGLEVADLSLCAIQKFPDYSNLCFVSSMFGDTPIMQTLPQLCLGLDSYFRITTEDCCCEIILLPDTATSTQLALALPPPTTYNGNIVIIDLHNPIPEDTLNMLYQRFRNNIKTSYQRKWIT